MCLCSIFTHLLFCSLLFGNQQRTLLLNPSDNPPSLPTSTTAMEGEAKAKQTTVKRNSTSEKSEVYLVTGGSGFVGQHVIKQLQERGNNIKEIRVFDTKPYYKQLGELSQCNQSLKLFENAT